MFTEKEFGDYKALYEKVVSRANEILEVYKKIRDEVFCDDCPQYLSGVSTEYYSANHVRFSSVEDQEIIYMGEEFWSRGGHESHVLTLPSRYLTSTDFGEELRDKFLKHKGELEQQNELKLRLKEAEERTLLSKLQEKYTHAVSIASLSTIRESENSKEHLC